MTPVAEVVKSVLSTEQLTGFESPSKGHICVTRSQPGNEISDLRTEVAQLKAALLYQGEKIAALELMQAHQGENELLLLNMIRDLKTNKETEISKEVKAHLDDLFDLIKGNNGAPCSVKGAAKGLGLDRTTVQKLKTAIVDDERFEVHQAKNGRRKITFTNRRKF